MACPDRMQNLPLSISNQKFPEKQNNLRTQAQKYYSKTL
jgi:hypothetical protein